MIVEHTKLGVKVWILLSIVLITYKVWEFIPSLTYSQNIYEAPTVTKC